MSRIRAALAVERGPPLAARDDVHVLARMQVGVALEAIDPRLPHLRPEAARIVFTDR